MRIAAFDPGKTTGWATHILFMDPIGSPNVDIAKSIAYGELTGEHHNDLWSLLYKFNPDVVVTERFTYQIRTSNDGTERQNIVLDSVEYIGILKLWCQQHPKCSYVAQQQMKGDEGRKISTFWDDVKLKHIGLYVPAMEHSNDAKRQLLSYVVFGTPKRQDYLKLLRRQPAI